MPKTIRGTLILILIVVILPSMIFENASHLGEFGDERERELQANLEIARAASQTFDVHIQYFLHQGQNLGAAITAYQPLDLQQVNAMLLADAREDPSILYIRWLDQQGRVIASSQPEVVDKDAGDQPYAGALELIVDGQDWAVSNFFVAESSNSPTFVIARGVRDEGSLLRGIVLVAVDPRRLGGALGIERSARGDIAIVDGEGRAVYRYPEIELTWEQRSWISSQPALVRVAAGEEVTSIITSPTDGVKKLAAFTRIDSVGWVAVATRPEAEVMGPLFEHYLVDTALHLTITILIFLVALTLGRRLTRPIGQLRAQALALAGGEIGYRQSVSGPRELEDLAQTFNRMADEIQVREEALQRARDELEIRVQERTAELASTNEELAATNEELRIEMLEHGRAEDALVRLRKAVECSGEVVFMTDRDGLIVYVNPEFTRLYGYRSDEVVGTTTPRVVKSGMAPPEAYELFWKTILSGQTVKGEFINKAKDGRLLWVDGSANPIFDEGSHIIGFLAVQRDISDRKLAEEKLKETVEKLQKTMVGTVEAMAFTTEMRDLYTAGHQRRVAELACAIAREMGLSEERAGIVRLAALVHDIGKISIPAEFLTKPGRISQMEFNLIKHHPRVGYDILKTIEFPWPIARIVLQHHERVNGSGYPSGLSSGDILLEAKIVGVADVVEAMASFRPYRPALGIDKALEEISANRGVLYDPDVADACLRLFAEKKFELE